MGQVISCVHDVMEAVENRHMTSAVDESLEEAEAQGHFKDTLVKVGWQSWVAAGPKQTSGLLEGQQPNIVLFTSYLFSCRQIFMQMKHFFGPKPSSA